MSVFENYKSIEEKVIKACERAGRDPEEVTIIAVSKTKPAQMITELYENGIRDFGENYVQELTEKIEELPSDITWHMIGHLQRNKVKYIVGKGVSLIHSVDSVRLAKEISDCALKNGITQDILIEINIGNEESKTGINLEQTQDIVKEISELEGVRIQGLMCIAPYVVDSEENRELFHKIKEISVDIAEKKLHNVNMNILSMGMSGDFEVAIEEGATMIRVGTSIFGDRIYNK